MRKVRSIQDVCRFGLCVSCGACVSAAPTGAIRMVLDECRGIFVPEIVDSGRITDNSRLLSVCPGKGMPIGGMARNLYGSARHDTFELGRYRVGLAAHSTNPQIMENASSGGVMTEIALYLLENDYVQGVTASRFRYGPPGPRTESFIARSLDELLSAQGSKYCPTSTNALVRECVETGRRYLFLGTPCQVGALRLAMREDRAVSEAFPYTMANFCGGYRDFRSLDELLSAHGLAPGDVKYFRFRGGGQPGSMLALTPGGKAAREPYPDYLGRFTRARPKRCWYCVDATGELADFACGDAWIPRFLEAEDSWSIVLARSRFAEGIVNSMASEGRIRTNSASFGEIRDSQRSNLASKKYRQWARMRVSWLLGVSVPRWDVEFPHDTGSLFHELVVLLGKTALGERLRSKLRPIKGLRKHFKR